MKPKNYSNDTYFVNLYIIHDLISQGVNPAVPPPPPLKSFARFVAWDQALVVILPQELGIGTVYLQALDQLIDKHFNLYILNNFKNMCLFEDCTFEYLLYS